MRVVAGRRAQQQFRSCHEVRRTAQGNPSRRRPVPIRIGRSECRPRLFPEPGFKGAHDTTVRLHPQPIIGLVGKKCLPCRVSRRQGNLTRCSQMQHVHGGSQIIGQDRMQHGIEFAVGGGQAPSQLAHQEETDRSTQRRYAQRRILRRHGNAVRACLALELQHASRQCSEHRPGLHDFDIHDRVTGDLMQAHREFAARDCRGKCLPVDARDHRDRLSADRIDRAGQPHRQGG